MTSVTLQVPSPLASATPQSVLPTAALIPSCTSVMSTLPSEFKSQQPPGARTGTSGFGRSLGPVLEDTLSQTLPQVPRVCRMSLPLSESLTLILVSLLP